MVLLLTFACWLAVESPRLTPSVDWDTLGGPPAAAQLDTSGRPPMNPPEISGRWPVVSGQKDQPTHSPRTTDHRPPTASPCSGTRDWYRGAREAFMADPGGPPLWVLMTLNNCPACEELEHDATWVQAMRRSGHFAVFVYDEDPDFGNAIVTNFSTFPFLVRFRWDAGQIRSDVLTDLAAIRQLPSSGEQRSAVGGQGRTSDAVLRRKER